MLKRIQWCLLVVMLMCVAPVMAQQPEGGPDDVPSVGQSGPPGAPGQGPGQGQGPQGPQQGGPPGARGPGQRPGMGMGPEAEARVLAFLKQNDPESYDELTKLKAENPQQYQRTVAGLAQRVNMMSELQKREPAAYDDMVAEIKLEGTMRRLVDSWRGASADKKQAVRTQLRGVLSQLFDIRQANRKRQVERLEKDLAKMRTTLAERAQNKASIVDKKLDDVLSDPTDAW